MVYFNDPICREMHQARCKEKWVLELGLLVRINAFEHNSLADYLHVCIATIIHRKTTRDTRATANVCECVVVVVAAVALCPVLRAWIACETESLHIRQLIYMWHEARRQPGRDIDNAARTRWRIFSNMFLDFSAEPNFFWILNIIR